MGELFADAPNNVEAEQALLAAILVNNKTYERVSGFLLPIHFYNPIHEQVYTAISHLMDRGQTADPVTVKALFEAEGVLDAVGGTSYIVKLAMSAVTIINATDYAKLIYDCWLRREGIRISTETIAKLTVRSVESNAIDVLRDVESEIATFSPPDRQGAKHHAAGAKKGIERIEAQIRTGVMSGVLTGYHELDRSLGGCHPSDLVVLAGRPSTGKSSLASNIAMRLASRQKNPVPVGIFSLEMSEEQWAGRELAYLSGISTDRQRLCDVSEADFKLLYDATARLEDIPIYIDASADHTIQSLRHAATKLVRRHAIRLVIVDYLQLLESGKRSSNRTEEVSEITRGLKKMAKDLDISVIALSQLSRAVEQREDKRPQLSDLRESGSIEQDADAVGMLYREEYYLARSEPSQRQGEQHQKFQERWDAWNARLIEVTGLTEITIAKSRHGPLGVAHLTFDATRQRFENRSKDELPERRW